MSLRTRSESFPIGWRRGDLECSLKCQSGTAEITSQNAIDRTKRIETILRNTSRYSHNSLGRWESDVNNAEKQIRATILHTKIADHKFDSDRPTAQTNEHYIVKTDEQRSFFKLMSKAYYSEVMRLSELIWFHSIDKQAKLAEQWKEVHWTVKLKRAEEHLVAIKSANHEVGTSRRKSRDDQWNLDSGTTVSSRQYRTRYISCQERSTLQSKR